MSTTTIPKDDIETIKYVAAGHPYRLCDELDFLFFDDLVRAGVERRAAQAREWAFVVTLSPERPLHYWLHGLMRYFRDGISTIALSGNRMALLTWSAKVPGL